MYTSDQADSESEISNPGIQFNPKINEELSRVHVTPKNSSITTQKLIFSLRVLENGFPELNTRESLYNVEPYNFADRNISQFLENTLSDEELHKFLLANVNISDNFMKKPANTSFFFAGGELRPDQFKTIDKSFYTESDIKFLLSNLKTRHGNVCTRTRDLQKIVCEKYGAIDTNAFLPYVQNAQGAGNNEETFWQTISRYQARGCEGEVLAMLGHKDDKNIWETIEKPELLKNPKVTVIIEISPEQPKLPTRIIFPHGLTEQIKSNYTPMFDNINIGSEDRDKILVLDFEIAQNGKEYKYEISGKDTVVLKKGEFELIDIRKKLNLEICMAPEGSPSVKPLQKLALYKESFTIQSNLPKNEKKSVLAQEGI